MWNKTVILDRSRGRPVYWGVRPALSDVQGALPRGWCSRCGGEVFSRCAEMCTRCEKAERRETYEEDIQQSQPVLKLHTGEGS